VLVEMAQLVAAVGTTMTARPLGGGLAYDGLHPVSSEAAIAGDGELEQGREGPPHLLLLLLHLEL
jgi:hypothetical protein